LEPGVISEVPEDSYIGFFQSPVRWRQGNLAVCGCGKGPYYLLWRQLSAPRTLKSVQYYARELSEREVAELARLEGLLDDSESCQALHAAFTGQAFRLACLYCDTTECDGVQVIPDDWADVDFVRSYARACEEVAFDDPKRSVFDWYTHLGVCPDCQKIYR
jgi:hypothetical protein